MRLRLFKRQGGQIATGDGHSILGFALVVAVILAMAQLLFIPASVSASSISQSQASSSFATSKPVPRTLVSPNAQPLGEFGTSVAASGSLVAVGAPLETVDGMSDAGRAYVFNAGTGALVVTLVSPNPEPGGDFAASIALSGNIVVVGAPLETADGISGAGRAYVFSALTGALMETLTSPNAQPTGAFGYAVAIDGGTAVVSALSESVAGFQGAGRAYTFDASTGALLNTMVSPNAQSAGGFGASVGISNGVIVVGAWSEAVNGVKIAGRAYTFNAETGALVHTFISPHVQAVGEFGFSVAISGSTIVVGAWSEDIGRVKTTGRVYTFDETTGGLLRTIKSPNPQSGGQFGFSVAVSGTTLMIGARYETVTGARGAGHAYVFNPTTGALVVTVSSPNAHSYGEFGFAVAVSGSVGVVGAPLETASGQGSAGNAYVYT